jgi:hypothetical protein
MIDRAARFFRCVRYRAIPVIALLVIDAGIAGRADDAPTKADAPAVDPAVAEQIEKARQTFWAFQPVRAAPPPTVKDTAWPLNALDRFILAGLEEKGLRPVSLADKRMLIRRATFDLIGLPPAPEAIDTFLADESPDAFVRVVESLLSSPHYGERWGRHWLDLVRYADTAGDNSDYPVPQLYKYRNWVIRAFNDDKPYDLFLREQIAVTSCPLPTSRTNTTSSSRPVTWPALDGSGATKTTKATTRAIPGTSQSTTQSTTSGARSWA